VGFFSVCTAGSLNSNLFRNLIALTLSQITETQVSFKSFDSSFSPKIRFRLDEVKFKKRDKTLFLAKTLWLEPSPMFLLSWKNEPNSNAFMSFRLEEGKSHRINIRKAEGILRASGKTITLESTKIIPMKGEILISGDYQKSLKAFDAKILTKQFALNSIKGSGVSGIVDLDATILGYISQKRKIIPMSGNGKILAKNGKIENPSITDLLTKTLNFKFQDEMNPPTWNFQSISGNFNINEGFLQTNDLKLTGNPLNAEGKGEVNFMAQSFNLNFQAKGKHRGNHQNNINLRGTFKKPQIYIEAN